MNRIILGCILAAFVAGFCPEMAAEESLADLLLKLESDDFTRREDAQNGIRAQGRRALGELKAAAEQAKTPESRLRLRALIRSIELSLQSYPIHDLLEEQDSTERPSLGFGEGYGVGMRYSYRDVNFQERQEQKFLETLRKIVDPHGWEDVEQKASILRGMLLVQAGPDTQKRVAAFLQTLRMQTQGQVELQTILVQCKTEMKQKSWSDTELEALLQGEAKDGVLLRSRVVTQNFRQVVVLEGRQMEYLPETVVAATEGGGIIGGVRAQQCLEGYALSLFPKWSREPEQMRVTITFYRNTDLSLRKPSAREKWVLEQNVVAGKDEKGAVPVAPPVPKAGEDAWALPSADLQTLHTEVAIPSGLWLNAGQLTGVKQAQKSGTGGWMYLLVRAEGVK